MVGGRDSGACQCELCRESSRICDCGDRWTPLQVARENNDQANGNNANATGVDLMDLYETSSDVYSLGVLCTISDG